MITIFIVEITHRNLRIDIIIFRFFISYLAIRISLTSCLMNKMDSLDRHSRIVFKSQPWGVTHKLNAKEKKNMNPTRTSTASRTSVRI